MRIRDIRIYFFQLLALAPARGKMREKIKKIFAFRRLVTLEKLYILTLKIIGKKLSRKFLWRVIDKEYCS
jgi:hypothetical protein